VRRENEKKGEKEEKEKRKGGRKEREREEGSTYLVREKVDFGLVLLTAA
jgi:hypothetical protein